MHRRLALPLLLFTSLSGGNQPASAALALLFAGPLLMLVALASRYLAAERIYARGTQL